MKEVMVIRLVRVRGRREARLITFVSFVSFVVTCSEPDRETDRRAPEVERGEVDAERVVVEVGLASARGSTGCRRARRRCG